MNDKDLDQIQSRAEFEAWTRPDTKSHDPEDDVPMGRCEDAPCCGCCSSDGSTVRGSWNGPAHNIFATDGGWPGDGSGMDDLADYNQMEGDDY